MRTTRRASLLTICVAILLLIGACSAGGGSPVTPDNGPDLSKYASSVQGYVYQNGGPVTGGLVYIYDLSTLKLFNQAEIQPSGGFVAGVDEGQYLLFAFSPTGWQNPQLEADFSSYINVEPENEYRADIELTRTLEAGDELVFGFVTSSENDNPVGDATVSAAGRSTKSDGYGFYAMAVPAGTSDFTISAPGFFDLKKDTREGQAAGDYYDTPFFELNPMSTSGSSIGGKVRDVFDGTGLGGVRVTLTLPALTEFGPIRYLTNMGGEYRFFNLQEGIYRLYFERPGYVSGSRDGLVIKEQDEVIINVFMHRDESNRASVWGYVNSASVPLPISGARVTACNPLLGSYRATTNPTGYYRLNQVIPGNYTITIVAPGTGVTYYEASSTFQTIVPGDNRVDFALRYINEGVLRGKVVVLGGGTGFFAFPPAGVQITAEKVGGSMSGIKFRTSTNGQGIFVFNGIPMGIYKIDGRAEYSPSEIYTGTMFNVMVNSGTTTAVDFELTMN